MEKIKNFFVEFKSIFFTDDLLKENESHANVVTATTMFNLFTINAIIYILVYLNVFKVGIETMNIILLNGFILLFIPAIICFIFKGNKNWLKSFLFITFTIMAATTDAILKYNATLIMVIPIVLASRYYNKKFTIWIAVITAITFVLSTYMSVNIGQQDINSYNLVIPDGTTLTIHSTLRESINNVEIDEWQRLINIYIHFFLPKLFLYNIVAFACIQISQSGKKMLEKQQEISKKGARIETELNLANGIQKNMLPSIFPPFPEHEEIDIYASMTPAKEVGGDFYDMFLLDQNHLGIVIADVSGKGIPAALFMMISKILIKNVSTVENDVQKVFNRVNKMLCDGNKYGLFVTSWLGILNLENGKLEFVNAGHNPPLLYTKRTGEFQFLNTKPNFILAGMEKTNYTKHEIQIEYGDRIFLYTDGVIEAQNSADQLFGEERLVEFLNNHLDLNVTDTIIELKKTIDNFSGNAEQFDDITMLEVLYKNGKENSNFEIEKSFKADVKELYNVQSFVQEILQKYGCDSKTISQINLALEEVFVNIASYAYSNGEGMCDIKFNYDGKKNFKIILKDKGVQFNPLESREPDVSLSAQDREIGGLGIYLTKQIMDSIEYRYEENQNILEMTKVIL